MAVKTREFRNLFANNTKNRKLLQHQVSQWMDFQQAFINFGYEHGYNVYFDVVV